MTLKRRNSMQTFSLDYDEQYILPARKRKQGMIYFLSH
jgi:hypothetical protein